MRDILFLSLFTLVSCEYTTSRRGVKRGEGVGSFLHAPVQYDSRDNSRGQPLKPVIAHVVIGNTHPYTVDNWKSDIALASAHGIDAFALNIGGDDWQQTTVADAYRAATGTKFKLFISFDMSAIPCNSTSDRQRIRKYIQDYQHHPNQLIFNDRIFISTFAGEKCQFGAGSVNDGWMQTLKSQDMPQVWFVPAFFTDPSTFDSLSVMDGEFSARWPIAGSNITFDPDQAAISHLNGRSYMAPCSPWFFTHYGRDTYNKNFMYRGDDWLFVQRWELLVENRDKVDAVEVVSWNDFGESHYIGPIEGDQSMSDSWVNGFDHQGWLELEEYYIYAFKHGSYPAITTDKIFLWARLYPGRSDIPQDTIGKPDRWELTEDSLWALVFSSGGTTWTILSCGNYSESIQNTGAGVFKIKMSFDAVTSGCQVSAELRRGDATVLDFKPAGFVFDRNPKNYNFNALVAGSQPQSSISGADPLVISGRFICLWAFTFALFMSQ